jgi:hypothetical protein
MARIGGLRAAAVCGAAIAVLAQGGCGAFKLNQQADEAAKVAYGHFWKGEDAAFLAMMPPASRNTGAAGLARLRQLIPPGPPTGETTTNWNNYAGTGGVRITLVQVYSYAHGAVTATSVLSPQGSTMQLVGFHIDVPLEAMRQAAPAANTPSKPATS